jgi:hypothetical protein
MSISSRTQVQTAHARDDDPTATLWHYTCEHGRLRIGARGALRPGLDALVWLTDLEAPHRDALGLSSALIACDRTRHRYRVTDVADVVPWVTMRNALDPVRVAAVEATPGVMVRHWFVSMRPVPAVLDEREVRP